MTFFWGENCRSPSNKVLKKVFELIFFDVGKIRASRGVEFLFRRGDLCFEVSPPPPKKITKKASQISTPTIINLKRNPQSGAPTFPTQKNTPFFGGVVFFWLPPP